MRDLPSVLRSCPSLPGSLTLKKTMPNVTCDKEEVDTSVNSELWSSISNLETDVFL